MGQKSRVNESFLHRAERDHAGEAQGPDLKMDSNTRESMETVPKKLRHSCGSLKDSPGSEDSPVRKPCPASLRP